MLLLSNVITGKYLIINVDKNMQISQMDISNEFANLGYFTVEENIVLYPIGTSTFLTRVQ